MKEVKDDSSLGTNIKCLDLLWKELENNYSENDVCVPILGSGTTSLSSHKIKAPHKLRIVCKKNGSFSINNIDG